MDTQVNGLRSYCGLCSYECTVCAKLSLDWPESDGYEWGNTQTPSSYVRLLPELVPTTADDGPEEVVGGVALVWVGVVWGGVL